MTQQDTASLFTSTLNTINAALAQHKDTQPYKALIQASEKALGDARIGVAVYDTDASAPFDYFTIRYHEGGFELVSHGKQEPDLAWKVSKDYLEKVSSSPQEYIDSPVKLDWDWLKSRVGVSD